ncbi:MAG: hypothetical protein H6737_12300 [Alphaproteobacteria bacterium]|nr:hypothetical protein [Alphaproteobacteria bacterium]
MSRALAMFSLMLATTGCMHDVKVGYLEAADIHVDNDIRTVLVIDRSRPKNAGEHVLAGIEGAATGETFRLDAESAALALDSLEGVLADAPRFDVVSFHVNGRAVDSSTWDRQLTARKVRELCAQARCDAVISLESFDSDTFTTVHRDGEAYTPAERREAIAKGDCEDRRCEGDFDYHATQTTDVTATFRMYDGRTGRVIDEQSARLSGTDTGYDTDDAGEALGDLPFEGRVFAGASELGAAYAARVSPHQVLADREIFGGGSPEMRKARKAMKRGDLETATALWEEVAASDAKLEGKALHNLAVAAEARGDVPGALQLARRANRASGKKASARYVAALQARLDNDLRVAEQLGGTQRVSMR